MFGTKLAQIGPKTTVIIIPVIPQFLKYHSRLFLSFSVVTQNCSSVSQLSLQIIPQFLNDHSIFSLVSPGSSAARLLQGCKTASRQCAKGRGQSS